MSKGQFTMLQQTITAAAFDDFLQRPENADKLFELIGGEIVEVPSNPYVSMIAGWILTFINLYLMQHRIGQTSGEAGGYSVNGERYAPDVAFIRYERQRQLVKSGYNPTAPDIAVEVMSSDKTAEWQRLTIKLGNYAAAGTVVWVVRPDDRQIDVHTPGQGVRTLHLNDTLTADVLPGFALPLRDLFANVEPDDDADASEATAPDAIS